MQNPEQDAAYIIGALREGLDYRMPNEKLVSMRVLLRATKAIDRSFRYAERFRH